MFIRCFLSIILVVGASLSKAQDNEVIFESQTYKDWSQVLTKKDNRFLIVPYSEGLLGKLKNYSPLMIPAGKTLHLTSGSNHTGYAMALGDTSEDNSELTCYRCAFGKIPKDFCGDYSNIYKNKEYAEKCPKRNE